MKKYRALWLMNHNTLRPFEVPLLIDMGYEVFCPKMYPYDEGNMSASVDDRYDETLTIPKETLDYLNTIDFYKEIPKQAMDLVNTYFDAAFFGFFPKQLKMLVEGFHGVLVMQPFGLAEGVTYTGVIEQELGISFLEKLEKLEDRFFFGQAYENIAEIEFRYFKNRAVYLPLGLKDAYVKDEWMGGDSKIFFVCPRIKTSPYFQNIYETFQKDFAGFDYVIGGAQPIEVQEDAHVTGYLSKEAYAYHMKHLAVMFYHSREKRHLHYHPLEAVKHGMPLIYLEGGLLEEIAGSRLPGCCRTIREARRKIKRIMRNDQAFIRKVKESQEVLLKPFQYEFCRKQWETEFKKIEAAIEKYKYHEPVKRKKCRLGILLTEGYTGGVLDYTLRFVKCMARGIEESGKNIELVFGHIDHDNFKEKDYFCSIEEAGIPIRPFMWKIVDEEYLNTIMKYHGWFKTYPKGKYCLADDGIHFFEDCDGLILCVDRVPVNFFTLKPYVVVAHDYIQRYLPQMYGTFYEKSLVDLQRNAESVIVMTQPALEDGIQYIGLQSEQIKLTPLMFDAVYVQEDENDWAKEKKDYFIWSTNIAMHKNHRIALRALSDYYAKGGKFACYITGVDTMKFCTDKKYDGSNEYVSMIRKVIQEDSLLKKNLVFCGNMVKEKYYRILKNAKFFMHPGFIDNGNMTAIEAAFLGVPTITGDYPAMRYYEETMKLNMLFFNPFQAKELSRLLIIMEDDYKKRAKLLPKAEVLEQYTIKHTYKKLFNTIVNIFKL